MRFFGAVLATLTLAVPLHAVEPTELEVDQAYRAYLAAVCPRDCPLGVTDVQARIRLLESYCPAGGAGPDCAAIADWERLPALVYDHRRGRWRAEEPLDERTELDVNGIPTTDLGARQRLVVVVESTNPLLYTVAAGKIELKPIEQFADLQTLAGLVGGNVAALRQVAANERRLQVLDAQAVSDTTFDPVVDALMEAVEKFREAQALTDCVTTRSQAASAFVQAVETGRALAYPPDLPQCQGRDGSAQSVRGLLVTLAAARDTVARRCLELPREVRSLIELQAPAADVVSARLERVATLAASPSCADWQRPLPPSTSSVWDEIERKIVDRLREAVDPGNPPKDLQKLLADIRGTEASRVERLVVATEAAKTLEEPMSKLAAALPALSRSAEHLDLFRDRVIQNVVGPLATTCGNAPPPCVPSSSIATFLVVPGAPARVTKWELVHNRPIEIAADTPFADVVPRRANAKTAFNVRSPLASIFDVGLAVTGTDIESPTFGAVRQDPTNFTNSPMVVGIVDQESQTGKIGLMLNVVPLRLFDVPKLVQPLGVQIGAAADSSKPALYWGLSYGLGKYVRVGWGRTAQRVTTLREETPLGSRIAAATEIRKRQDYEYDDYWSLMISIRALRLFTR